jgi:hypothetical protein
VGASAGVAALQVVFVSCSDPERVFADSGTLLPGNTSVVLNVSSGLTPNLREYVCVQVRRQTTACGVPSVSLRASTR